MNVPYVSAPYRLHISSPRHDDRMVSCLTAVSESLCMAMMRCDGFFLRLDALAMTNQPNDIHYHAVVRTPWRLSFQSSSAASVSSDFTATSSSSIRGLNSFTSKALFAFGEATLRRATAIVIQTRLRKLKSQFPHKDSYESPNLPVFYRDVLELTRYVQSSII